MMSEGANQKIRCAGCGKVIGPEAEAVRIGVGTVAESGFFEEKSIWGQMHRGCFGRAIDDPRDALARIKKLAGK